MSFGNFNLKVNSKSKRKARALLGGGRLPTVGTHGGRLPTVGYPKWVTHGGYALPPSPSAAAQFNCGGLQGAEVLAWLSKVAAVTAPTAAAAVLCSVLL